MTAWGIIVCAQLLLAIIIMYFEGRALRDQERVYFTFSRTMWLMFLAHPWTRYLVGAVFLGLALFNAWGFFHIFFGPCAFGICPGG
jgi:hypothetical protein